MRLDDMKRVAIYTVDGETNYCGYYLSHGVLLDKIKEQEGRNYKYNISTRVLLCVSDEDANSVKSEDTMVYCLHIRDDVSGIFSLRAVFTEAAIEAYRQEEEVSELEPNRDFYIARLPLHTTIYPEPKYPMPVIFTRDMDKSGKDRYYTRIVTTPNYSGRNTAGKMFFPDKSWNDKVFPGTADVTIKFQKDNFGILMGKMRIPKFATIEGLINTWWGVQEGVNGGELIRLIKHPILGEIYAIAPRHSDTCMVYIWEDSADGEHVVKLKEFDFGWKNIDEWTAWEKTINQIFIEQTYGKEADLERYIDENFTQCHFSSGVVYDRLGHNGKMYSISATWVMARPPLGLFTNDLFSEAASSMALRFWYLAGYKVWKVEFNTTHLYILTGFEWPEIEEIVRQASAVNERADEEIKAYCRSGKLTFNELH